MGRHRQNLFIGIDHGYSFTDMLPCSALTDLNEQNWRSFRLNLGNLKLFVASPRGSKTPISGEYR
jgi:hypothetical protein